MNRRVFLDMDGVLCDMAGALLRDAPHVKRREVRWGNLHALLGRDENEMWSSLGYDFWASLPWTREGKELLDGVAQRFDHVALLSSPTTTHGCCDGKRAWVRREMPGYATRLILANRKQLLAAPDAVLIDDHDANVLAWREAGGIGVLVPRPWNTAVDRCDSEGNFDVAAILAILATLAAVR